MRPAASSPWQRPRPSHGHASGPQRGWTLAANARPGVRRPAANVGAEGSGHRALHAPTGRRHSEKVSGRLSGASCSGKTVRAQRRRVRGGVTAQGAEKPAPTVVSRGGCSCIRRRVGGRRVHRPWSCHPARPAAQPLQTRRTAAPLSPRAQSAGPPHPRRIPRSTSHRPFHRSRREIASASSARDAFAEGGKCTTINVRVSYAQDSHLPASPTPAAKIAIPLTEEQAHRDEH